MTTLPTQPSPGAALSAQDMQVRAREVAALLKTLAHPVRLLLACALAEGEYAVGELEARLDCCR